ncbi:hypothetical protein M9H77_23308 [Catharanthus roseus]|uniref:Uncharacterized protein n=1 Tax=Catharanthus roseus TaxID=4058 RepID=A0ACC0ASY1_CATRO|nr:hypothetical protein M9H77_23308 [Catharanthus roseus]
MSEKSIKKQKCIKINEKDRMEKKRLVDGLCVFESTSILTKESEKDKCTKEKEHELEQSESKIKENECFIEKQDYRKRAKRKEIVVLDKNEVVSVFTNQTNSIFVSDSSCVQNILIQNMENKGSLDYKIYKIISFFIPTYLYFDHFLKETKLNSLARKIHWISLEHPCTWISMLGRNNTIEFQEQREII